MENVGDLQQEIRNIGYSIGELIKAMKPAGQGFIDKKVDKVLGGLFAICQMMRMNPAEIIIRKLEINTIKYDEQECRSQKEIKKWTEFSHKTGITEKTVLPIIYTETKKQTSINARQQFAEACGEIAAKVEIFARNRKWLDKYNENSLALSLYAELGELAEVVQWEEQGSPVESLSVKKKNELALEMADIFIYTLHVCRVFEVAMPPF